MTEIDKDKLQKDLLADIYENMVRNSLLLHPLIGTYKPEPLTRKQKFIRQIRKIRRMIANRVHNLAIRIGHDDCHSSWDCGY